MNSHSTEEICEYAKRNGKELDESDVSMAQSMYGALSDAAKKMTTEVTESSKRLHGPFAEANVAEYLRYYSGHKLTPKDGIVIPDMIKLGNNPYQISEFVGDGMSAERQFDFGRLGLMHTDVQANPANLINGICVDLGGITAEISTDKLQKMVDGMTAPSSLTDFFSNFSQTIGDKFLTGKFKRFASLVKPEQKSQFIGELGLEARKTKDMIKRKKIDGFVKEMTERLGSSIESRTSALADGAEVSESFSGLV